MTLALAFTAPAAMSAPNKFDTPTESETMQTDQTENLSTETDTFDYAKIEPTIRESVRWLRAEGFDVVEANAFVGTITIDVQPHEAANVVNDINAALVERGIFGRDVCAEVYPHRATVTVTGLFDELLLSHPQPENITRPSKSPLGSVGYEAYAQSTGGKTFDGRDMPRWSDLPERIQKAWNDASLAIRGAA